MEEEEITNYEEHIIFLKQAQIVVHREKYDPFFRD